MDSIRKLQIGNVTLENNLILAPMAGVTEPAISLAVQRAGGRAFMHGNGQCQGNPLQK